MIARTLFSGEHDLFRETVRRFVDTEIVPFHADWETAGVVSRDVWQRAGTNGLLCCAIPSRYGGQGADFLSSVIVVEELARAGATGPLFQLHSDVVARYILEYGTEEQKLRWLPSMGAGSVIGALAISEPRGGSDVQRIETRAERDSGGYVLNGQKVFISNGQLADLVIVAAQTEPGSGAKGVTLFLVEGSTPGFVRGRNLEKIGLKAQDTSELFFSDARVPEVNRLGDEGAGFGQLMTQLAHERLLQSVRAVSTAEAAIAWTVSYTKDREVFGKTIASFQNTQFTLAELHALVTAERVFVDRCIALHLSGELTDTDAAIAKLTSTELQCRVVDECLQFFGGWGYMWEYPIARAFADSRQAKFAGGSVEVMKVIIARSLLGRTARDG